MATSLDVTFAPTAYCNVLLAGTVEFHSHDYRVSSYLHKNLVSGATILHFCCALRYYTSAVLYDDRVYAILIKIRSCSFSSCTAQYLPELDEASIPAAWDTIQGYDTWHRIDIVVLTVK